ncbi:pseudaminic acid cytidylyltransferase [Thermosynechococcus sp. JY1334]|uniref:pseudaminic acid cytidylyltransferase n=1 Tax=unclassified Thermosynechococcus TaxID=2622553 RepID=UPI002671BEF3|nr:MULTISPECIES: pseudaminic acid cytidylyltransferase [unclassified Thermosynechococcus]MDR7896839.1 pseudaminic acid cytidylyltransferase [Thermosynechococcus sp. JY1332]MDR7904236.1 pseudaminic acid cytidylyltransferase [Thermosynechococcus sp. JY1334]WKT86488.1 pseudaminic acid cytidylyltransferase [Thermosynechococcus sp. JY1339]WNC55433.1 pseudaminic acid cytidylyltransferase [Thermosynechococcus sp. JY1331]
MKVAIIPARGGSKRIPRKNIRNFCGKPMIAYAIAIAQDSCLFDRIVVSTEDPEIATVASQWGAEVPFVRPASLADDYTGTTQVIAHGIQVLQEQGCHPELVCCIYPAVPLLQADDLKAALNILLSSNAPYVFPVTSFPSSIQRALRRHPSGQMEPFYPEYEQERTQDLEPAYYDAGQFYWGRTQAWLADISIHQQGIGLVIPQWRVVDIDTLEDWQRAELLYKVLYSTEVVQDSW